MASQEVLQAAIELDAERWKMLREIIKSGVHAGITAAFGQ